MKNRRGVGISLEINVNDQMQLVEIWLTRAEAHDAALLESWKPLCAQYQEKKYLVAVFYSGGETLESATGALLRANRKQLAQQAVSRQQRSFAG